VHGGTRRHASRALHVTALHQALALDDHAVSGAACFTVLAFERAILAACEIIHMRCAGGGGQAEAEQEQGDFSIHFVSGDEWCESGDPLVILLKHVPRCVTTLSQEKSKNILQCINSGLFSRKNPILFHMHSRGLASALPIWLQGLLFLALQPAG